MPFLWRRPAHDAFAHHTSEECGERVAEFFTAGLRKGASAIVIATPAHADVLQKNLSSPRIHWRDADQTLRAIMRDGRPDPNLFDEVIGRQVHQACKDGPVFLFGEMVGLLCARGDYAAAIELEHLWNRLLREADASLICAYPAHVFQDADHAGIYQSVRRVHRRMLSQVLARPR